MARRTVSIRWSLVRNLAALVGLLTAGLLIGTEIAAARARQRVAADLTEQTLSVAEMRVDGFFTPVEGALELVTGWGRASVVDETEGESLERLLAPVLRAWPQVASIVVADENGRAYRVGRSGGVWSARTTDPADGAGRDRVVRWSEGDEARTGTWDDRVYDTRSRPWYTGAVALMRDDAPGPTHWTEPYRFFTFDNPGVSASRAFRDLSGAVHVVSVNVLLEGLSGYTESIRVRRRGRVCMLTPDGRLVGLPGGFERRTDRARRELLLAEIDPGRLPMAAAAQRAIEGQRDWTSPARLRAAGETWWAQARPVRPAGGPPFILAVLVPESELLEHVGAIRAIILGLATLALALGLVQAVRVAGRFSEPIEALAERAEAIGRGDRDPPAAPNSRVHEVRRLADAQDRMRDALTTLAKVQRDLQLARQIQQGTFPKRLPTLPGFDLHAWNQPADDTGGDAYDVIGCVGFRDGRIVVTSEAAEGAYLLLADATGHGIGPALSVTQVRAMLRMAARTGLDVPDVVRMLNEQLCDDLPPGRFITLWVARIDAQNGRVSAYSAGQGPVLRYDAARDAFDVDPADGPPLGIVRDYPPVEARSARLDAGDLLAVLSDGIFETLGESGAQFGVERTQQAIRAARHAGAESIVEEVRRRLNDFDGGAPAADDRTAVVIRRTAG